MRIAFPIFILLSSITEAEDQFPIQRPVSEYTSIWESCPFNREVVKAAETRITSSFGKNLALDGLSYDSVIGPIAYLRDLSINQPFMVTKKKNDIHPYSILEATETDDPREAKVTVTNGEEIAEIRYTSNLMTKTIAQPSIKPATPVNKLDAGSRKPSPTQPGAPPTADRANQTSPIVPSGGDAGASETPEAPRKKRFLLPNRIQN
tara:strand:+ start:252 stop:869 length:618 start_codon:yes stop_codon:yes gene_type:complete